MASQKAKLVIDASCVHIGFGHDQPIAIEFDRGDWVFMNAEVGEVRRLADGEEYEPLWVTGDEEALLIKMMEYILARVKITPDSEAGLRRLLARLTSPHDENEVEGESIASDGGGDK